MKKFILALSAAAVMGSAAVVPTAPAMAHDRYERGDYYRGGYNRDDYYRGGNYYRGDSYYRGDYYRSGYDRRYDNRRHYYRGCDSGTGGTIIGAIAGGLLGHEVAGRHGDKTAGVIIGAGVGALAGRAIDKSNDRCR